MGFQLRAEGLGGRPERAQHVLAHAKFALRRQRGERDVGGNLLGCGGVEVGGTVAPHLVAADLRILVARGSGCTILAPAAAIDAVERGELAMAPIVEPRLIRPVYLVRNPAKPLTRASAELERITLEVVRDLIGRGIWRR